MMRNAAWVAGVGLILSLDGATQEARGQAYTLDCAAITWGGDTLEQGQIGAIGQAVAGPASNVQFTLDAGIVPCLAAEATGAFPIPTVSEWGLGAMGLLILTAGTLVFRYRSSSQPSVGCGG